MSPATKATQRAVNKYSIKDQLNKDIALKLFNFDVEKDLAPYWGFEQAFQASTIGSHKVFKCSRKIRHRDSENVIQNFFNRHLNKTKVNRNKAKR